MLARALDVENERVVRGGDMEDRVASVACAAAVEAVKTNIKASGIVLYSQLAKVTRPQHYNVRECAYDRIETLGAVFSVDRLICPRWAQL
jgi:hypothetical protein